MRAYVARTLPGCSPILVCNRAPHEPKPEGGFKRGSGGVITALLTLAEATEADWVACARNDEERRLATSYGAAVPIPLLNSTGRLHYAIPTKEQYDMYYGVFANPVLWLIQHYLWDLGNEPIIDDRIHQAWEEGYVEVNKQVADKVVAAAPALPNRPLALVHHSPLYAVPRLVRHALPAARLQQRGQVQFWAFLQPSRQDVAVYSRYLRQIRQTAGRINSEFGTDTWMPIRLEIGESERKAVASLKNFDVLLVNPVYDGLNLVVKEGALVNGKNGVIVLSENAGAHEELQAHVLSINPFDVEATAAALYVGLKMTPEERRRLNEGAREVVRANDITRWISRQVQDLRDLVMTPVRA